MTSDYVASFAPGGEEHAPACSRVATVAFSRAYPGDPGQIREVRGDLRQLLDGCPIRDDVILCASELTTNAILHSHSGQPGATFAVRAEIHPGSHARLEVEDDGGPWHRHTPDSKRSHGLDIIQSLATEWNIDGDQRSRTVWARINWPDTPTLGELAAARQCGRRPRRRRRHGPAG
jgi:Histidine kinase-like ATPase domain